MNNRGYLGQPGPRTSEFKTWITEIKKGILLTAIIWAAACLIWLLISAGMQLVAPHSNAVYWFRERPRVWLSIHVWLGIPCLLGLIVWARQELLDADWTSLQGKHGLSGIMPMTPAVRSVLFWKWWRENRPLKIKKSRRQKLEDEYRRKLGKEENNE